MNKKNVNHLGPEMMRILPRYKKWTTSNYFN